MRSCGSAHASSRAPCEAARDLRLRTTDCNWAENCQDGRDGADDLQTTLQAIDLSSGDAHTLARGLRNVIGYSFDRKGRLLFTSFGSDNAAGIPGGNHHNVPDCDLNAMALPDWLQ